MATTATTSIWSDPIVVAWIGNGIMLVTLLVAVLIFVLGQRASREIARTNDRFNASMLRDSLREKLRTSADRYELDTALVEATTLLPNQPTDRRAAEVLYFANPAIPLDDLVSAYPLGVPEPVLVKPAADSLPVRFDGQPTTAVLKALSTFAHVGVGTYSPGTSYAAVDYLAPRLRDDRDRASGSSIGAFIDGPRPEVALLTLHIASDPSWPPSERKILLAHQSMTTLTKHLKDPHRDVTKALLGWARDEVEDFFDDCGLFGGWAPSTIALADIYENCCIAAIELLVELTATVPDVDAIVLRALPAVEKSLTKVRSWQGTAASVVRGPFQFEKLWTRWQSHSTNEINASAARAISELLESLYTPADRAERESRQAAVYEMLGIASPETAPDEDVPPPLEPSPR